MKIEKRELVNIADTLKKDYFFEVENFENNPFLRRLENIRAELLFYYDLTDELVCDTYIECDMVCPCAITLDDVYVPLTIDENVRLSFHDDGESYFIEKDLDVMDYILSLILPEVPIKVVKSDKIEYPNGDGWKVLTEETYEASKADEIDPRLAKLREYKFDEEE